MNYKLDQQDSLPEESVQTTTPRQHAPRPKWRSILFHLTLLGCLVVATLPLWRTFQDQAAAKQTFQQVQVAKEQAVEENREVFQVTQQMKDPSFLEDVARRDYYYTKPGEVIFELGSSQEGEGTQR